MNALNSILSYIQRPISIKTLESNGIQVFADAAKTQFRNVMNIFQDVAAKWPTLSSAVQDGFVNAADDAGLFNEELAEAIGTQQEWNDLQQRDISQAAAGVYRRNYFIGMIERLSGAQKVLNNMTDAAGYSMAENERTMDTLEKKYLSLQAAAQQLAVSMGDAGMLGVLKGLTDAGTDSLQWIESWPKEMQDLIITFVGLTIAIKATQGALKLFGVTLPTITAVTTGVTGLKTAVLGLGASLKAAFVANLPLLIISGVVAAIVAVVGAVNRANEEAKKFIETTKQNIQSLSEEKKGLQELSAEYETLKAKQDALTATADEKLRLLEIQRDLVDQYGVSISGIDSEGRAYSDNLEMIKLRTKALEDELAAEKALLKHAVDAADKKTVRNIEDDLADIKKYEELANTLPQKIAALREAIKNKSQYTLDNGAILNPAVFEFDAQNMERELSILERILNEAEIKLMGSHSKLKEDSKERQQDLQNDASAIIKQLEDNEVKVSDSARAFASEFAKSLSLQPKDIQTQRDALERFIGSMQIEKLDEWIEKYRVATAEGDTEGIDEASKMIMDFVHNITNGVPELNNFALVMESTYGNSSALKKAVPAISSTTNELDKFGSTVDEIAKKANSLADDVTSLNQIMYDLQQGEGLSAKQVYELIDQYPELAKNIVQVGDSFKIEISALEDLRQATIDEQNATLDAQAEKTKSILTETYSRLGLYSSEVSAIKDLETAQSAYSKLDISYSSMGYGAYSRLREASGMDNPYKNEEEFNEAVEAGKKLLELGELYEAIEKKKEALSSKGYGVSDSKSSSSKTNEALQDALDLIAHKKALELESTEQELEDLIKIRDTVKMNAEERWDIEERIYTAEKSLQDERLKNSINWINEKKALDQLSAEEEIAAWNRVLINQKDNIEARKEATVNLYRLGKELREKEIEDYKDKLKEQQDAFEEAYKSRIDAIENEKDEIVKAENEKIRAIEDAQKAIDRAREKEDYEDKRAKLLEKRQYHELRTGEEHRKAILDIDKELADLEVDYNRQKQDDKHEDDKQAAQDRIEAAEENAKEQKRIWETTYEEMEVIFDEHSLNIIAAAGLMAEGAYQEWVKKYIEPMKKALAEGDVEGLKKSKTEAEESIDRMKIYQNAAAILDLKKEYEVEGDKSAAERAKSYYEELEKQSPGVADQLHKMNYKQTEEYLKKTLPQMHGGGETFSYGAVYMKPGELVFPPSLSTDLKTLIAVTTGITGKVKAGDSYSTTDNRKSVKIDSLIKVENMHMEDEVDAAMLSREMKRALVNMV